MAVYRSSLMTFQSRDLIPLLPKACRAGQKIRPHSTRRSRQPGGHSRTWPTVSATPRSSHSPRGVRRVGVDPISDPDTAIMEILLAALGRPNFTGQDRHTYCAHCDFGCTELRGQGQSR
jgi:hypothetical protein